MAPARKDLVEWVIRQGYVPEWLPEDLGHEPVGFLLTDPASEMELVTRHG